MTVMDLQIDDDGVGGGVGAWLARDGPHSSPKT
jgi:hypothetical protein